MKQSPESDLELLNRRKEGFDSFLSEMPDVLSDFAELLEILEPKLIVANPESYLAPITQFMKIQEVTPDDRSWIITRIGYLIGEILNARLGGCWFVNEIRGSRYFAQYVVGRFKGVANENAMVDPFLVAADFVDSGIGRDLQELTNSVEAECMAGLA